MPDLSRPESFVSVTDTRLGMELSVELTLEPVVVDPLVASDPT